MRRYLRGIPINGRITTGIVSITVSDSPMTSRDPAGGEIDPSPAAIGCRENGDLPFDYIRYPPVQCDGFISGVTIPVGWKRSETPNHDGSAACYPICPNHSSPYGSYPSGFCRCITAFR